MLGEDNSDAIAILLIYLSALIVKPSVPPELADTNVTGAKFDGNAAAVDWHYYPC